MGEGLKRAIRSAAESRVLAKRNAFKRKCEKVSEDTGIPMYFPQDGDEKRTEQFEDDGYLHICREGVRACFDVGEAQALSPREQNANTQAVMAALGMAKKIDARVMVEEPDDEEGVI